MDPRLGLKIDEGACADIYEWKSPDGADRVLKLSKTVADCPAMVEEYRVSRVVWETGLPVARPHELVEIDGRTGIVFDRIRGESGMQRLIRRAVSVEAGETSPEAGATDEYTMQLTDFRAMARALAEIHGQKARGLRSQRDVLKERIERATYLAPGERAALLHLLERLPRREQLCHGDPNPGNFLFDGERVTVIDWRDATSGNPEADLARLLVLIRYSDLPAGIPPQVSEYLEARRERMAGAILNEYQSHTGLTYEPIEPWIALAAAYRIVTDPVSEVEKDRLGRAIRRLLSAL